MVGSPADLTLSDQRGPVLTRWAVRRSSTDNEKTWAGGYLPGFDTLNPPHTSSGDPSLSYGAPVCRWHVQPRMRIGMAATGGPPPHRGATWRELLLSVGYGSITTVQVYVPGLRPLAVTLAGSTGP